MEDEIQAGEDGLYCVGFKNVFALNRSRISEALAQYGRIHSIRGSVNGIDRKWAFVRYSNPEEAVRAITALRQSPHLCNTNFVKYMADGRPGERRNRAAHDGGDRPDIGGSGGIGSGVSPLVRESRTAPGRSPVRPPSDKRALQHEVYVGNWPVELEKSDILGLFAKFNIKVLDVRLYKKESKSYAFVVVDSAEAVARAIENLNNGKVSGRQIIVKDSRDSLSKRQPVRRNNQNHQNKPQHQPRQHQPRQQQQQQQQPPPPPPPQQQQQVQQGGSPSNVRQRLGAGGGWRGGAGRPPAAARPAMPDITAMPAMTAMPPLVMPGAPEVARMPPLVMPGPDPLMAPPPPAGRGAQFRSPGPQFNGVGRAQYGRQPLEPKFESPPQLALARPGLLGQPGLAESIPLGTRRTFNQRGDLSDYEDAPYVKRGRYDEGDGGYDLMAGAPALGSMERVGGMPVRPGGLPPARRTAAAISERIKSRLHAPMEVVVANFPVGTNEQDLMAIFRRFEPLNVRIMVNNSSSNPDDFTYAYVTLSSRMAADEAVMEMDGLTYQGRPLVVETRKN